MSARNSFAISVTIALLLAATSMCGQTGGSGSTGTTGGTGTGTAGKTTTGTPTRPTPPTLQEERRIVFLRGNVAIDDGSELPERAAIERVCGGQTRREAYTDSHGNFSFQLGFDQQVLQDASVSSFDAMRSPGLSSPTSQRMGSSLGMANQGVTQAELMSCELRASLRGFYSELLPLAGRQLSDASAVGTIVLHRLGKVQGTRVSATSLQAPKEARKAFERGQNLLKKGKKDEAAAEFSKAIESYPKYAEALARLGDVYVDQGRGEEGRKLYEQALAADSRFMPPYFGLASLAARERDWQKMADLTKRALALNAYEYPAAYFYDAVANYNLQNVEAAEKSARAAQRLDVNHRVPRVNFLLANILLQRNDYAGAAKELRSFLQYVPSGNEADAARKILSDTEARLASAAAPK